MNCDCAVRVTQAGVQETEHVRGRRYAASMADATEGDHGSTIGDHVPDEVRRLPFGSTNTAPSTRSRFRYQDECIALVTLQHLAADDLQGILVEHSTDLILIPKGSPPELVSIKHREVDQAEDSGWSWTALKKQSVLLDLYRQWCLTDRSCRLAFWSNAGFVRSAQELRRVLVDNAAPSSQLVHRLAKELDTSVEDARKFLEILSVPDEPLPRRKEITAQGIRQVERLLKKYRRDAARHAEGCYRTLVDHIATAGTDLPNEEKRVPQPVRSTLAALLSDRQERQIAERYFDATATLDLILDVFDAASVEEVSNPGQRGWESDPHFSGRIEHLDRLRMLLRPGSPHEVAPVVVHGFTGCGKTSLAAEFASEHADILRVFFINAETRASLVRDLAQLTDQGRADVWKTGISNVQGPVTPTLPGNSRTLFILDGVTDADSIHGIIPRRSLCRILITSTVAHLDQGYEHVELGGWRPDESRLYLRMALPDATDQDRQLLADKLHHHPLALTQAANHCRVMRRSVPDFLDRLVREPLDTLDIGKASGHHNSTVQAIKLNIASVCERETAAGHLLSLLAHLGSDPLPLALFEQRTAVSEVANLEPWKPTRLQAKWRKLANALKPNSPKWTGAAWHDQETMTIASSLGDLKVRDRAIEALLQCSLAGVRDGGLVVHPLIGLIVRHLDTNHRRWLEIGYGLIIVGGQIRGVDEEYQPDALLGHLSALTLIALEGKLRGISVVVACIHLARRLASLGQLGCGADDPHGATYFCRTALDIVGKMEIPDPKFESIAIRARETLATIYFWQGETNLAIKYHEENIAACAELNLLAPYLMCLQELADVACARGRGDIAQKVLDTLARELPRTSLPVEVEIQVSHIKVTALRLLSKIDEAVAINERALEQAKTCEGISNFVLELIYQDKVVLARYAGDHAEQMRYELANLDIQHGRQNQGRRPDRRLIEAVRGSADAALENGNLDLSLQLINKACALATDQFGTESDVYAQILATRGRLFLHLGLLDKARCDLKESESFFRSNPEMAQGYLPAVLLHLAHIVNMGGNKRQALEIANEAYEMDRRAYGEEHPETRKDVEIIQAIMRQRGRPDRRK